MYLFYTVCNLNTNNMGATTLEYIDIFLMHMFVQESCIFINISDLLRFMRCKTL